MVLRPGDLALSVYVPQPFDFTLRISLWRLLKTNPAKIVCAGARGIDV